jgi:hypothetical protein
VSAFEGFQAAAAAVEGFHLTGEGNEAAVEAMNNAEEDCERVVADVSAWLLKGGAWWRRCRSITTAAADRLPGQGHGYGSFGRLHTIEQDGSKR